MTCTLNGTSVFCVKDALDLLDEFFEQEITRDFSLITELITGGFAEAEAEQIDLSYLRDYFEAEWDVLFERFPELKEEWGPWKDYTLEALQYSWDNPPPTDPELEKELRRFVWEEGEESLKRTRQSLPDFPGMEEFDAEFGKREEKLGIAAPSGKKPSSSNETGARKPARSKTASRSASSKNSVGRGSSSRKQAGGKSASNQSLQRKTSKAESSSNGSGSRKSPRDSSRASASTGNSAKARKSSAQKSRDHTSSTKTSTSRGHTGGSRAKTKGKWRFWMQAAEQPPRPIVRG